jgi:hypothetical protein
MTTVTRDPASLPMPTVIGLRAAAERTVLRLREDAHKLERFNQWDHARVVYDEIAHIEALLVRPHFFDLFAEMLKETANGR